MKKLFVLLHLIMQADAWPLLVVVPASMRLVWAEELEKWLPDLPPHEIRVIEGKADRVIPRDIPQVTVCIAFVLHLVFLLSYYKLILECCDQLNQIEEELDLVFRMISSK